MIYSNRVSLFFLIMIIQVVGLIAMEEPVTISSSIDQLNIELLLLSKRSSFYITHLPELLKDLFSRGANINIQDSNGNTPLLNSIQYGQPLEIISLFVAHRADVNKRNNHGETPLFTAIRRKDEEAKYIVTKLIATGVDVTIQNDNGKKAIDYTSDPAVIAQYNRAVEEKEIEHLTLPQHLEKRQRR